MMVIVGISQRAVEFAVLTLSQEYKGNYCLLDIAEFIGCHERTIKRIMPKLIASGVVIRKGSSRTGYRYELGQQHAKL